MAQQERLRRQIRATHPPRMRLTARDVEILKTVAEYRIVRQDHIQTLFFGSRSTAQYRLSHLFQHGFLARHFLPVYAGWSPTLYTLDTRGVEMLRSEWQYTAPTWNPHVGHEFLAHTLSIADVRVAISLACRAVNYKLILWRSEAEMKADYDRVMIRLANGSNQTISLIPDSYFVVETPQGRAHFFVELDRGTETLKRFAIKVLAYQAYVANGQYQKRYPTRSLRVLTVTTSPKRLAHLKTTTEQVGGGRMFWFATANDVLPEKALTAPIWHIAGETTPLALLPVLR
jgi:hypothetical protein